MTKKQIAVFLSVPGLVVLCCGFVVYVFSVNYSALDTRGSMEKEMKRVIRRGYSRSAEEMTSEILEAAGSLGLEITEKDVSVSVSKDEHNNPVIDAYIDYSWKVDLIVFQVPISLPISEELVILKF